MKSADQRHWQVLQAKDREQVRILEIYLKTHGIVKKERS